MGERVVYISRHDPDGSIGLRERRPERGAEKADRYAIGLHHLAFSALSRVAALEARLDAMG